MLKIKRKYIPFELEAKKKIFFLLYVHTYMKNVMYSTNLQYISIIQKYGN